ncbi:lipoyl synthase [Candidatus Woesearchaeota archaeon]|nr:lipoyl synthase [Candidatus Woesearchaeota archaeon]
MLLEKPAWLTIRPPTTESFVLIKEKVNKSRLHTVCEEAHCPNLSECWSSGTATFMIMGDTCTRACRFCTVKTSFKPKNLDPEEPLNLARTIKTMNLDYVVITSVNRDDLDDQGADHFAECIKKIREINPGILIEVLIPDFRGDLDLLKVIINAKPEVIAHNIETVQSLQRKVRDPRANYEQSLFILKNVKKFSKIYTKSSIMLGLGETDEEVVQTMKDLRGIDVDFLTLGQYLRPSMRHLEIKEYVKPEKFNYFKIKGEELGFKYVASGPFVRSSYKAGEFFIKNTIGII